MTTSTANEIQVAGTHYRSQYQHWDFVVDAKLGYFEGQISKYITRHRAKNGKQDVEKALHFCDKWIELVRACKVHPTGMTLSEVSVHITRFSDENRLQWQEHIVVYNCAAWFTLGDTQRVRAAIRCILQNQYGGE